MIKCPNCGNDFDEKTGRRPKRFCSNGCKVMFWNGKKKVQVQDLTKPTETNQAKPPETTNTTIDTTKPKSRFEQIMEEAAEEVKSKTK